MRLTALALLCLVPGLAFGGPTKSTKRLPATSPPPAFKVLSIFCKNQDNDEPTAYGLATVPNPTPETGSFGLTIYVKPSRGPLLQKTLSGTFTTVPEGLVLRAPWSGQGFTLLHLHPAERTAFPGLPGRHICETTGHLE